jgi:isoamylase
MVLPGDQITESSEQGDRTVGDSFAILLNAHHEVVPFRLGARRRDLRWKCILDTAAVQVNPCIFEHTATFPLQAGSLAVLRAEVVPTTTRI